VAQNLRRFQDRRAILGKESAKRSLFSVRKLVPRIPINSAPVEDGCATTFVIKRLTIQVLSIKRKPEAHAENIRVEAQGGSWDQKLIQIWPIGNASVTWPPLQNLSEHDGSLKEFIRRFAVGVRFNVAASS